jgi:hypothetical protein
MKMYLKICTAVLALFLLPMSAEAARTDFKLKEAIKLNTERAAELKAAYCTCTCMSDAGAIFTYTDAIIWTARASGTTQNLRAVCAKKLK